MPAVNHYPSVNPGDVRTVAIERNERGQPLAVTESGWAPAGEIGADGNALGFAPVNRVTRFEYGENGELLAIDGAREDVEDVTRFVWDEQHRVIEVQLPEAPAVRFLERDVEGRVTRFAEGRQSPVSIGYDAAGNVASVEQLGRTIRFAWDGEGRMTRIIDPDGATTHLAYDATGELAEVRLPNGESSRFEHDSEGRSVGQVDLGRDGTVIRSVDTLFGVLGRIESVRTETLGADGNLRFESRDWTAAGRCAWTTPHSARSHASASRCQPR